MESIKKLQELGYIFTPNGSKISYFYIGIEDSLSETILKPLFDDLIANKEHAIQYLKGINQVSLKIEVDIDFKKDYDAEVQKIIEKANLNGIKWQHFNCYKKSHKLVMIGVKQKV